MQLYLIRHGQSYVNLKNNPDGNIDAGLTPLGQQQAQALHDWLIVHLPQIDIMYCSTMKRARETAAPLIKSYDCKVVFEDRLREIGNNRLDHTPWPNDKLPEYGDFWGSEMPFASVTPTVAGGEALIHFRARVGSFIEDLVQRHSTEVVVVVCHGGVIESCFDHIFDVGMWRRSEVWTFNTGISRFQYVNHPRREAWRLHFHNRVDHLRDLGITNVGKELRKKNA